MIAAKSKSRSRSSSRQSGARRSTPKQKSAAALKQRAEELATREIGFVDHPGFRRRLKANECQSDAQRAIENSPQPVELSDSPSGLPAHLRRMCDRPVLGREEEVFLFRRMNYLKYRANRLRSQLNPTRPSRAVVDELEDVLERAECVRNHIILSNVRLVISIAKKYANTECPFDTVLSIGIGSLMNAVEKFDFSRGFRFSTYATRAIRRDLYRAIVSRHSQLRRFCSGLDELMAGIVEPTPVRLAPGPGRVMYDKMQQMLDRLDPRESFVLRARFGFENENGKTTTYSKIGRELGVSKERVRQIAEKALEHLRELIPEFRLEAPLN